MLHLIAGPVNAVEFLREARWANETYQLAMLENPTDDELKTFFRGAHAARLQQEAGARLQIAQRAGLENSLRGEQISNQAKVHLLLSKKPMPELKDVYRIVFEQILNERISMNPVKVNGK